MPSKIEPIDRQENSVMTHSAFSFSDLSKVAREKHLILFVLPFSIGCLALGASFLITPTFTSTAKILQPAQQQTGAMAALLGAAGGVASALGGIANLKNPGDQWVSLLRSRTVSDAIITKFNLQQIYDTEYKFQARERLAERTRILAGKDGLIDIEVDDSDPERATEITATYIEELQKLTTTLAITEASQRRAFLEAQLSTAHKNLADAEVSLKNSGIQSTLIKASPAAVVEQLARMQASIAAQEITLSSMQRSMTANNPVYQAALDQYLTLKKQLLAIEGNKNQTSPRENQDYIQKYRDFKYRETLYELVSRQYEMAKFDEARDGANIQVVDAPQIPEYKSKPKRAAIALLATTLAFCLSVAYCLATFNRSDNTIHES